MIAQINAIWARIRKLSQDKSPQVVKLTLALTRIMPLYTHDKKDPIIHLLNIF